MPDALATRTSGESLMSKKLYRAQPNDAAGAEVGAVGGARFQPARSAAGIGGNRHGLKLAEKRHEGNKGEHERWAGSNKATTLAANKIRTHLPGGSQSDAFLYRSCHSFSRVQSFPRTRPCGVVPMSGEEITASTLGCYRRGCRECIFCVFTNYNITEQNSEVMKSRLSPHISVF
jgi:hypothetical protein